MTHFRISLAKSVLRIIGGASLPFSLIAAGAFIVLAEVLGIVEELYADA